MYVIIDIFSFLNFCQEEKKIIETWTSGGPSISFEISTLNLDLSFILNLKLNFNLSLKIHLN